MTYAEKLRDPRWQRKRLEVMERDGWKCRDCGNANETLTVHHCFYEKGGPWETDERFLITVCQICHEDRQAVELTLRRHICEKMQMQKLSLLMEFAMYVQKGGRLTITTSERFDELVAAQSGGAK